jgi:hypothetical protein
LFLTILFFLCKDDADLEKNKTIKTIMVENVPLASIERQPF